MQSIDEFTLQLHNPLTEDERDAILDVDMAHTTSVRFRTKHGEEVEFIKPRHGQWIDIPDRPEWDQKQCSLCGDFRCCQGNYCPNCGAIMDGGGDGER